MRYFKTKELKKWAKKEKVSDTILVQAYAEFLQGQYETDLGNCLFKKRIGIKGKGKRGGGRIILFYKVEEVVIFCFGYSKSGKSNLSSEETDYLNVLSNYLQTFDDRKYEKSIQSGVLFEIG